jgi:hypothetical protein
LSDFVIFQVPGPQSACGFAGTSRCAPRILRRPIETPMLAPAVPPPVLEVYYSPACETCRRELPALAILQSHEGAAIRIVILEREKEALADVQSRAPRLLAYVKPPSGTRDAMLAAAGDEQKLLPYARSVRGDGRVCARWVGRLVVDKARALLLACKRHAASDRN